MDLLIKILCGWIVASVLFCVLWAVVADRRRAEQRRREMLEDINSGD